MRQARSLDSERTNVRDLVELLFTQASLVGRCCRRARKVDLDSRNACFYGTVFW